MTGKKTELGPIGRQLRDNLRQCREARRIPYVELSRKLAELGRDIPPLGLRRIEAGQRKVDVDDLMALSLALGMSPLALMLPIEPSGIVDDGNEYTAAEIWDWASGKRAVMGDQLDFLRASNPLDWPRMAALVEHMSTGGVGRELAAGILSSRASSAALYDPAPEISDDEAREIARQVKAGESDPELDEIIRQVKASRGDR